MAKASANVFPYVHLAPAAAPASPAAGSQRLYLDSGDSNKLKRKDSSGTVTTIEGGGAATGGILAYKAYEPSTLASYTTTIATVADVDATNLIVTFTAPSSGKVLVKFSGLSGLAATSAVLEWQVRDGSTTVGMQQMGAAIAGTSNLQLHATFVITGLTASTSYTYKWGWRLSAATTTGRLYAGGTGTTGPAVMEIHALP